MKFWKQSLLLSLFLAASPPLLADTIATTDTGKEVLLKDNGTWKYLTKKADKKEPSDKTYFQDENVRITFDRAYIKESKSQYLPLPSRLTIELTLEIVTKTKLIRPKTHRIFGYDNGSDVGGVMPIGVTLKDNYSNNLSIDYLKPTFYKYNGSSLRYGTTTKIIVSTEDLPVEAANHILLRIKEGTYGNQQDVSIKIYDWN